MVAKKGPAQPWWRGGGVGGMVGGEGKVLDVLWCPCVARMVGGLLVVRRWGWIVRVSGCILGLGGRWGRLGWGVYIGWNSVCFWCCLEQLYRGVYGGYMGLFRALSHHISSVFLRLKMSSSSSNADKQASGRAGPSTAPKNYGPVIVGELAVFISLDIKLTVPQTRQPTSSHPSRNPTMKTPA